MSQIMDLTGHRYHKLLVIKFHHRDPKHKFWECKCDCGNTSVVEGSKLRAGTTKSCGCHRKAATLAASTTHGMTKTKEHNAWCSMRRRCLDPKNKFFKDYGGRGIKIYEPWITSFEDFYAHIGPCPDKKFSVDRIDVNGDYAPGNVRWASYKTQANNTRKNFRIEFRGEIKTPSEWSEILNIDPKTIYQRLYRYGWSVEDALTKPSNSYQIDVTYLGETRKLCEWAELLGLSKDNLYKRIVTRKWPVEKAMTAPSFVGRNQFS